MYSAKRRHGLKRADKELQNVANNHIPSRSD
jgi:hypothetical protein